MTSEKQDIAFDELQQLKGVPKTLCIPLWARANAKRLTPRLGFDDPTARLWCEQIGVDSSWIEGDSYVLRSCIARAKRLDEETALFLREARGQPVAIISLGAGLCSRMDRLGLTAQIQRGDPHLTWIDLDLPEVIALRKKIRPAQGSHQYIGRSLTDPNWLNELGALKDRRILILIEGVLVYLEPEEVREFFEKTTAFLINREVTRLRYGFDFLDGPALLGAWASSSIRKAGARIHWAPHSLRHFLKLAHPNLKVLRTYDLIADLRGPISVVHSLYRALRGIGVYSIALVEYDEPTNQSHGRD